MNWKTRSWEARFGHLNIGDDDAGDNSGGGGGGTPAASDNSGGGGDGGGGSDPSPSSGDTEQVDLSSENPEDIIRFPANHRLSDAQLSALMAFNPKKKEPIKDPTVQQQEPVAKPVAKPKTPAPAQTELKPGQKKAGDPYFDHKVNRWRDGKTNRITVAPKGAQAPPAPEAQPQQLTAEQIAAAVASAVKPQQPAAPAQPAQPQGGGQLPPFYGQAAPAMQIPDELAQAMFSDDPGQARQGVEQIINGMANVIMRDVIGLVSRMQQQTLEKINQEVVPQVTSRVAQQQSSNTFYERYPTLNNALFHSGLDQVGKAIAKQWQAQGIPWRDARGGMSEDFMDAVAAAFAEATGISISGAQEEALQPPPVQPKSKRAFFNRTSQARPPAATQAQLKSAAIMDVVRPGAKH